jgi:hypothetical protein
MERSQHVICSLFEPHIRSSKPIPSSSSSSPPSSLLLAQHHSNNENKHLQPKLKPITRPVTSHAKISRCGSGVRSWHPFTSGTPTRIHTASTSEATHRLLSCQRRRRESRGRRSSMWRGARQCNSRKERARRDRSCRDIWRVAKRD